MKEESKEDNKEYKMPHECPCCTWQCYCDDVPCSCCNDLEHEYIRDNQRLREELKKAQEENERWRERDLKWAKSTATLISETAEKTAEIERLKALFPECWNAARNFYDGHTFSKRYLTLNEWKKDKGL